MKKPKKAGKPAKPKKPPPKYAGGPLTVHTHHHPRHRPRPQHPHHRRHPKAAPTVKHAKHHKRRTLALGEAVGCCVAEALAASLRLAGWPVGDADVLALHEAAGGGRDAGVPILAALEAAAVHGLAGIRPASWFGLSGDVTLNDHLAQDSEFAGAGCVLCELLDEPEQQAVPWPEPLAGTYAQVPPLGVLPPFFEFATGDREDHGCAEFAAPPPRVAGVADLDIHAIGGEVADRSGRGEFAQGHLNHAVSVAAQVKVFNNAAVHQCKPPPTDAHRCQSVTNNHGQGRMRADHPGPGDIRDAFPNLSIRPGVSLVLGLELPGPHAVTVDGPGLWTWGEWHPWECFPHAVIEEAWAVRWPA